MNDPEKLILANASRRVTEALEAGARWNDPAVIERIARESGAAVPLVRQMMAARTGGAA